MIRCALVDDEPLALELLEDHVAKVPFLEAVGSYRDALAALEALKRQPVDLLFLDINMPDLTGMQLLRALREPPLVIFTTAYSAYAVESYAFEAVDYLLKPIEFDRFLMAAQRARAWLEEAAQPLRPQLDVVFVKSGNGHHRVLLQQLLYVEGAGNYVVFVTTEGTLISLMTMTQVMELLGDKGFVRVHRSYVVNLRHVEVFEADCLRMGRKEIPIGETYRQALKERLLRPGSSTPL